MWTKNNIPDLTGKTAIVTGANAGIGFETALALYEAGAHVILACRNMANAEQAISKVQEQKGKGSLEAAVLDLSSLSSVANFATVFIGKHQHLHLLINNAGVMIPPASQTTEGYELQFGVNFLGHFALTGHLYPLLESTAGSRIVTVSSQAYLRGIIDFDNLKLEKSYDPMREYSQSKMADLIFSVELQRRISSVHGQTISVAAQPGANKTELARHMSQEEYALALEQFGELMEPWQGALPSLLAAVSPDVNRGALYGPDGEGGYKGFPAEQEIAPNALDEVVAKRLWNLAEQVTDIQYPFS